jgi:hypothetical protein
VLEVVGTLADMHGVEGTPTLDTVATERNAGAREIQTAKYFFHNCYLNGWFVLTLMGAMPR